RRDWDHFMVVANAGNREEVAQQLRSRFATAGLHATVDDETAAIALIAIQGPAAAAITMRMCELGADDIEAMKYFTASPVLLEGGIHVYAARTGYTGED